MPLSGIIKVQINVQIDGASLQEIYLEVLKLLVDTGRVGQLTLPIATSKERYILAQKPVHPNGNPFFIPIEYKGYYLESHKDRTTGLNHLEKYCLKPCGLSLTVMELGKP